MTKQKSEKKQFNQLQNFVHFCVIFIYFYFKYKAIKMMKNFVKERKID